MASFVTLITVVTHVGTFCFDLIMKQAHHFYFLLPKQPVSSWRSSSADMWLNLWAMFKDLFVIIMLGSCFPKLCPHLGCFDTDKESSL